MLRCDRLRTGLSRESWDGWQQTVPLYELAIQGLEKIEFQHQNARTIVANTIAAYENAMRFEEADRWQRKWLSFLLSEMGMESPTYVGELTKFGLTLVNRKAWQDAETVLRECLTIRERTQPDLWTTFNTQSMVVACFLGQQKLAEAEPLLLAGYEGMKQREATIPKQAATRIPEALDRLIELYTAIDKPDETEKYRVLRSAYPAPEKDK